MIDSASASPSAPPFSGSTHAHSDPSTPGTQPPARAEAAVTGHHSVLARNNVRVLGAAEGPVLMLAQGFGCDQVIWNRILPHLQQHCRLVLFDHVGTGRAAPSAYDAVKYSALDGYLDDLCEILDVLDLQDVTLVAHTAAGMMGITAAAAGNRRISRLVLIGVSACYLDVPEEGYAGGLAAEDIDNVLAAVSLNLPLMAASVAPKLTGQPAESGATAELVASICRLNPEYVRDFLRLSLQADVRHLLPALRLPVLILQSPGDPLTPAPVSHYLQQHIANSVLVRLDAKGNMPHVSAPRETAEAILRYLSSSTHVLH